MSRAYITRVAGDYGDKMTFNLQENDGSASDLTGATVRFKARREGDLTAIVNQVATIENAVAGVVSYTPSASDFANAGLYYVEIEATVATRVVTWEVAILSVIAQLA